MRPGTLSGDHPPLPRPRRPLPAIPMSLSVAQLGSAFGAPPSARAALEQAAGALLGAARAWALSSGRAALAVALSALARLRPDRRTVLLPAYTCPSVARAVQAAGLEGLCVEVDCATLNVRVEALLEALDERVLAVIVPHMFGVPADLATLLPRCREQGVFVVEDLAQATGGSLGGRPLGTFGDLAVTSLARGKPWRGAGGGLLWSNDAALHDAVGATVEALAAPAEGKLRGLLQQAAIITLSRPRLWNVLRQLPATGVGAEDDHYDPRPSPLAAWQAAIALSTLPHLEPARRHRAGLAAAMATRLDGLTDLWLPQTPVGATMAFPRFVIRLASQERREHLSAALQGYGVDARSFYRRLLPDYDWWQPHPRQRDCPDAATVLHTHLTLPLYYAMDEAEAVAVAELVRAWRAP